MNYTIDFQVFENNGNILFQKKTLMKTQFQTYQSGGTQCKARLLTDPPQPSRLPNTTTLLVLDGEG